MEKQHGPWKIRSSAIKYKNDFLELIEDQVIRPDGKPGSYAMVRVIRGVAILAIDDAQNVFLTKQFRYAIGADSIEVISGGIDSEEESPLEAAQREALEEAGIEAREWIDMGLLNLDTSMVHSPVYMFIARAINLKAPDQDNTEDIRTFKVPLKKAIEMVMSNQITHSHSCTLILKAAQMYPQAQ